MNLSLNISVYLFKEESTVIAYCPSLDLSGCGIKHGTLCKDLRERGFCLG